MRKTILLAAVACAFSAPAASARHIKLEAGAHDGAVRFLTSLHVNLEEGKRTSWVTITRTGNFTDPRYGKFSITRDMLLAMVSNFDKRAYGQDIFIDVSHKPDNGAAGKITKLTVEGDRLRALVEWTEFGVSAIRERGFVYLSAEYHENFKDNEKGERHGPVLLGAGLTVRPVIKGLDPIQLSEDVGNVPTLLHPELQTQLLSEIQIMWKELIKTLTEQLKGFKLGDAVVEQIIKAAEIAVGKTTDETVARALCASFGDAGKKLAEEIAKAAPGAPITVQLSVPDSFKAGMTPEDVKKLMETMAADQATAAKKLAEDQGAKVKLLTDTIAAAQGLDDDLKKELTESVADLVTADMTEDQVKRLAAVQVAAGNRLVAARQLAGLGYQIQGSPYITVESGNEIKSLQEKVDKFLRFSERSADERYPISGGAAAERNKKFVERVLAEYDAANGARLHAEHKLLAAGSGLVSDIAIPAWFERTVIREALSDLVSLALMDVGTHAFAAVVQIPYSFRDTTAAGRAQARRYEGQGIPRAGIKQQMDEARPFPQKLSTLISEEMMRLASNGQLTNWDVVVENVRNATRIIAEDTEHINMNGLLADSDEFGAAAVTSEAVATADGTKTIFALDHFPVVRPKKIFDLQGTQVGSTLYPITITTNAVARSEYDGTNTQSAGLYYKMDFNLGEVHFVNELGVPTAPTNTHAIVATYHRVTNVFQFNTDLGSVEPGVRYDDFLYRFGLRKALIEDQRFHACNVAIMSGTVRTQIEQARQFGANFRRAGTDLMADGNLGRIKDVPSFKSTAPGLNIGDQRVIIGERGVRRFRMCKPWAMEQLENARDPVTGLFTAQKEAFGTQWVVSHTPAPLKAALTSMVLYSATARADR